MIRILGRLRHVVGRIRGMVNRRALSQEPSEAHAMSTRKEAPASGKKRRYIYPLW